MVLCQKANFLALAGFLSKLFMVNLFLELLLERESNKSHAKEKSNRQGVLAQLKNREGFMMEVECNHQGDFLVRLLHGFFKVLKRCLPEGDAGGKISALLISPFQINTL